MVPENGPESGQSTDSVDQQNIWSSILKQVQTSTSNKLPASKAVLVLGDNQAGKTSLIAKMQGNEDPKKGSGLEYHHIQVRDEYRDEQTKLGFWLLDGDSEVFHKNLLTYALNEDTFEDTTVVLTASMTSPWDLMSSLKRWARVLEDHVSSLKIPKEKERGMKAQVVKRYLEYISPGDEVEALASSPVKTRPESLIEGKDLPDGVLTKNLGLDIIVVITKTDFMSVLEKQHDYKEEAFDFIQQSVRKFCLTYGASLFYVSAKINKNCDLLYKYLVHRIYNLPFKTPALVVEKDAVFIPSGWDNEKKISILYENIQSVSPDDEYSAVIVKPAQMNSIGSESEVVAEDDQVFLTKMQTQLNQTIPSTGSPQTPSFQTRPSGQKVPQRGSLAAAVPSPNQLTPDAKGSPAGEGVLQNFFNSLLNRKTGPGGIPSPGNSSPRSTNDLNNKSRVDVAAELDRMASGGGVNVTPSKPQTIEVTSKSSNES